MPISIRPAIRDDVATLVAFQLAMAWETERLKLDKATVTRGVAAVFDDPAKGSYLVAERDGRIVGGLLTTPEWSDWRNGTILWIQSLYVVPEARRQGVFAELYGHLRRQVEASPELRGLRLYVDRTNAAAAAVYSAIGMRHEHYQMFEWLQ